MHLSRAVGDKGFTLPETLAAVAILSLALVGVLASSGLGVTGVDGARRSTSALFLAEQRMEQVRAFALSKAATQGWANLSGASFPAESYGGIAGSADYRRTVTVTNNPGGAANTKQVEVWVFYRPVTSQGVGSETSVALSTLLVLR